MSGLRERLPAAWLDGARAARETLSPSRRRVVRARRSVVDELAVRVSPDGRVLAGPFVGLRLPHTGSWGGHAARLTGAYEEEIADRIEAAIQRRPRQIIDAGAAEGYYAVGLARRIPEAEVIAYDIDREARRACAETARLNGVTNVAVRGRITPRELRRHLSPGALLLSDVEGYERELIDPSLVPVLCLSQVIVELHEFASPGVTDAVIGRFRDTHTVELVNSRPRSGRRPQLAHLDQETAERAIQEGRPQNPPMQWAVLSPFDPRVR